MGDPDPQRRGVRRAGIEQGGELGERLVASAHALERHDLAVADRQDRLHVQQPSGPCRGAADASAAREVVERVEREQELVLFDSRSTGNSGSSSLSSRNAGDSGSPHRVRGRRLDDVVRELGLDRVDLIKADVEGAELLVLRGSTDTLSRFHPALVLEVVPRQLENMGASVDALESVIRSFGYAEGRWVDYKNKEYEFAGRR